jgi:hypothetical protein
MRESRDGGRFSSTKKTTYHDEARSFGHDLISTKKNSHESRIYPSAQKIYPATSCGHLPMFHVLALQRNRLLFWLIDHQMTRLRSDHMPAQW